MAMKNPPHPGEIIREEIIGQRCAANAENFDRRYRQIRIQPPTQFLDENFHLREP